MPSEERRKKNRQPKSGHGMCDLYAFGNMPVLGVLQADFQSTSPAPRLQLEDHHEHASPIIMEARDTISRAHNYVNMYATPNAVI